jgi:DNA polymerase III alpha subunit (gram-positive type)
MTHIMVDVETTGVTPDLAGIIQIAAMKFNPMTLKVGAAFDMCPMILPRRRWDDSTRKFWMQDNRDVLSSIIARQRPAREVFQAFADFCSKDAPFGGYIFVAKPVKFDWPLIESNMLDLDIVFPFAHGKYLDMHSWISGLRGQATKTTIEDEVPFPAGGSKHNALHDVAWQIDCMFKAKRAHVTASIA